MLDDKLVKHSTRDLMWTSQKTSDGKETGYGYGFGVRSVDGFKTVGHSGGQQGTATGIVIAPDKRSAVVVLSNMEEVDAQGLATTLLKLVTAH